MSIQHLNGSAGQHMNTARRIIVEENVEAVPADEAGRAYQ
jgi:hypothetical protein